MYDLVSRELKPDEYAAAEEERRLMWVEIDAATLAAKYDVNMSKSDIDAAVADVDAAVADTAALIPGDE